MSRDLWDPAQYAVFAGERQRPYFELLRQVAAAAPARVVDLGCGPGELTATLTRRWPDARVLGIDSSPEMIEKADKLAGPTPGEARGEGHHLAQPQGELRFQVGDIADWRPDGPVDVIVSNAALQWVPGHQEMLARWVETLTPGGWLAFQVPGNFAGRSHRLLREVAAGQRWRDRLAGVLRADPVAEPAGYFDLLAGLGCAASVWETTYLQLLHGDDPVLEWMKGTALRPVLTRLDPPEQAAFLGELAPRLRAAYPAGPHGTVFPFRRVFAVARRP